MDDANRIAELERRVTELERRVPVMPNPGYGLWPVVQRIKAGERWARL